MSRDEIMAKIESERDALRSLGVRRLGLFGSAARGEATEGSDLDFVVELEPKTFDSYMGVKFRLEEVFGRKVDLVLAGSIKPQLREIILGETVYAEGL